VSLAVWGHLNLVTCAFCCCGGYCSQLREAAGHHADGSCPAPPAEGQGRPLRYTQYKQYKQYNSTQGTHCTHGTRVQDVGISLAYSSPSMRRRSCGSLLSWISQSAPAFALRSPCGIVCPEAPGAVDTRVQESLRVPPGMPRHCSAVWTSLQRPERPLTVSHPLLLPPSLTA